MLLVNRKAGEEILINHGQIQIKVIFIKGNQVELGIQAPPEIDIQRKERFLRDQRGHQ